MGREKEMMGRSVERILVEGGTQSYGLTRRILGALDDVPRQPLKRGQPLGRGDEKHPDRPVDPDKRSLRLVSFKGEFLKPCPGTKSYICCGYQILHLGTNCPLDCSYCILQAYFNQPSLRVFVNLEERLDAIGELLDRLPDRIFRIGTGEFMDSLALNPVVQWHRILFPFFSGRDNVILELKTKTDSVRDLLDAKERKGIVLSWSLNGPRIAALEEKGAPSIERRLQAAGQCQREGFALGFHFDPIIRHRHWEEDYARTMDMLDRYIDPRGIIWMSLGCFRYMPDLKPIILKRHPGTNVLDSEFVPGLDGKMRYFKPIRIEMYAAMRELMRSWHGDTGLYLCMESDEIWSKAMGWSPCDSDGLSSYLDQRARRFLS